MLTQSRLKSVLDYDPVSGSWTWLFRPEMDRKWNVENAGYDAGNIDERCNELRIGIDGRIYRGHQLAFLYVLGRWPVGRIVVSNRADCRWENLANGERP